MVLLLSSVWLHAEAGGAQPAAVRANEALLYRGQMLAVLCIQTAVLTRCAGALARESAVLIQRSQRSRARVAAVRCRQFNKRIKREFN